MSLTSTLFTGLSGLDANQVKLNVVGNNIANVNTVAFKSSRVLFKPQFYVTDAEGTPPSDQFGGTNPNQRGLGAVVAAVQKNLTPGSIEPTGRVTDLAIDGEGFFIVQGSEQQFTRDGSFILNASNQLVTSSGAFVQGYGVDGDFNVTPGQVGNISLPLGSLTSASATEGVTLEGNLNASGEVASGASVIASQSLSTSGGALPDGTTLLTDLRSASDLATALYADGDELTLSAQRGGRDLPAATLAVSATTTVQDLMDFLRGALGIDTSVTAEPVPGVTLESDSATSARMFIVGNLGRQNALTVTSSSLTKASGAAPFTFSSATNAAGYSNDPTGESVHTSFVVYDSLGTPLTVGLTMVFEESTDAGNTWRFFAQSGDDTDVDTVLGTGTLTFDSSGALLSSTGTEITLDRANTGARTPLRITLDFTKMTSLTSRTSELVMTQQDGSPIGTLNAFSIGADGTISGSFTNGLTRTLGRLAIATFDNPQGLIDKGGNMYVPGASSGVPVITSPLALGAGAIRSGALELSNVDLSEEFINLIIASTGFSAASRVITTSDQLITELLNASR